MYEHFEALDIRVGTILEAEEFNEACKAAYKLKIDFGALGIKQSSAQITDLYSPDSLLGKQVVCCMNLGVKQIGPFLSEVLVLGALTNNGVVLLHPDQNTPNGSRIA